jgi:heme-degrading monooxygenase HmoA
MTVRVIGRMSVDPEILEKLFAERKSDFEAVASEAKALGALHHEFLRGDGEVWLTDVWETAEQFEKFFASQPIIGSLLADAGVSAPPEINICEVMDSPDRF